MILYDDNITSIKIVGDILEISGEQPSGQDIIIENIFVYYIDTSTFDYKYKKNEKHRIIIKNSIISLTALYVDLLGISANVINVKKCVCVQ